MRIGIDIDGVLTDIEKFELEYGTKWFFERCNKKLAINNNCYGSCKKFNITIEEDNTFWNDAIWEYIKIPARSYASEVIKMLKENGHEIYIVTARVSDVSYAKNMTKEKAEVIVKNWLKDEKIHYDKLIFTTKNKIPFILEHNVDIMIDDKPRNILDISKHIPVMNYICSSNKDITGKNIFPVYSWYDIYILIQKMQKDITQSS